MTDTQKDEKMPLGDTPPPANDPGPEAAPAEPAQDEPALGETETRLAAIEAELAAKTAELAAFKDSALRQLAETQNLRRRAENEMAETRKYGAANFAREVLTVADNLKRALAAASTPAEDQASRAQMFDALRQGVELTDREFTAILERQGIKRIDPMDEKFDPNFHQAVFEAEAEGAEPGTVMQVVQAGYRLQDRLLRPAMVGVAKAKASASTPELQPDADGPSGK